VNLQNSATQNHPGAKPPSQRHHPPESPTVQHPRLQPEVPSNNCRDLHLQSRRLSSPTLKTCNDHALRRTLMNNDEISCMQSQPSRQQSRPLQQICNVQLHISPAPHPPEGEEFSTNRPSSPQVFFWGLSFNSNFKKIPKHTCNSCKPESYSEVSSSPCFFPIWFHVKISCLHLLSV